MVEMTAELAYEQSVRQLSEIEKLRLLERIAHELACIDPGLCTASHSLSELRGMIQYPACGEDAQQWVSGTRAESDEARRLP